MESLDFPIMQHARHLVIEELLKRLGIPDQMENIQDGGRVWMSLSHINGVAFMPLKFANTPVGVRVWQWEELGVM